MKEMNLMADLWIMSFRSWNIRIYEPDEFNQNVFCLDFSQLEHDIKVVLVLEA